MGLGAGDGLRARCPECGDGKWELRTEEGQRGEEGEEEARRKGTRARREGAHSLGGRSWRKVERGTGWWW
jgi:hypothetical protein